MELLKIDYAEAEVKVVADMIAREAESIHSKALMIHSKALACHCECLAFNAENTIACCSGLVPPYSDAHYYEAMQKWGLIDKKGEHLL